MKIILNNIVQICILLAWCNKLLDVDGVYARHMFTCGQKSADSCVIFGLANCLLSQKIEPGQPHAHRIATPASSAACRTSSGARRNAGAAGIPQRRRHLLCARPGQQRRAADRTGAATIRASSATASQRCATRSLPPKWGTPGAAGGKKNEVGKEWGLAPLKRMAEKNEKNGVRP